MVHKDEDACPNTLLEIRVVNVLHICTVMYRFDIQQRVLGRSNWEFGQPPLPRPKSFFYNTAYHIE